MLIILKRAAFMRQRQLRPEQVLLQAVRVSSAKDSLRRAISSAGCIWDRAEEPTAREGHRVGNLKREPGDRGAIGWGNLELVLDTVAKAIEKGPYLFGDQFTAADLLIGGGLRWGMMTKNVPIRPEFSAYAQRIGDRPAAKRANARDKEIAAGQKK